MELLCDEKSLAVLLTLCHPALPAALQNHLPAKARAGEISQQDGTGAVGRTDISHRALRQILKPPDLSLMENLHPPGPALCKAHSSQALELFAKNTCATPHPARALHFRGALGLALLDANISIPSSLDSSCCSFLLG